MFGARAYSSRRSEKSQLPRRWRQKVSRQATTQLQLATLLDASKQTNKQTNKQTHTHTHRRTHAQCKQTLDASSGQFDSLVKLADGPQGQTKLALLSNSRLQFATQTNAQADGRTDGRTRTGNCQHANTRADRRTVAAAAARAGREKFDCCCRRRVVKSKVRLN